MGTNWQTEILAGLTTFITMAYIVLVNPSILHEAGMPYAAVVCATCLSAAFGSLFMGIWARYPLALAPGMGLNAYFAYSVVIGMHIPWQTALGAVFLSGLAFLALTLLGVRQLILASVPRELYAAVAAGVGMFIAFIGMRSAGLLVLHPPTVLALGNFRDPKVALSCFGLLLTVVLMTRRISGAILIGIVSSSAVALAFGLAHWQPEHYRFAELAATAFQMDLRSSLRLGLLEVAFIFLFVDFFDNVGTMIAVGRRTGLVTESVRDIPRLKRILIADSAATIFSSLAGTSTVVSYVESAAGVEAGGRSGVTAITTGILFLFSLVALPLLSAIPPQATAPALIVVGSLMMTSLADIEWSNLSVALPCFLTVLLIPLTSSIANGLAFGFVTFVLLKVAGGGWREVNWLTYGMTALFILRFVYLSGIG